MTKPRVRVAVIGVGHLGRHHARLLAVHPDVELVAVVDTNRPRAEEIGHALGVRALGDARELRGLVDAVTIHVVQALARHPAADAHV